MCIQIVNSLIEIYGDKFHANPEIYKENDFPHPYKKNFSAKQIQQYDLLRQKYLEEKGYKIIVIWEKEINKIGIKEVSKCIKKLLR